MKAHDGIHPELNSNTLHLRVRFFAFVALITVVIISAGLINYYIHDKNEKLEKAHRLSQEQFTDLQQVSEKFHLITTRGSTISPRTLELIRQDLLHLTSKIQDGQLQLERLLKERELETKYFWLQEIYPQSPPLSEIEIKVIRWLHQLVSNKELFLNIESLHLTQPLESLESLESAALLQTPWHIRLNAANEQFNKHIQSHFRTTGFVIWTSFLGLFIILWMIYYAIVRPALFRLQDTFNRSQSKLYLQTALATVLEDVSSKGPHLCDSDTESSKILNQILHKHKSLKACDLTISNNFRDYQKSIATKERIYLAKKLSCIDLKEKMLCIQLPISMREYSADILPFLTALANHLSALFEIRLRMTAESQRDTYYQIADTAINALPTPVVVFDESQRVMLMNPACQSFFSGLTHSAHADITLIDLAAHNNTLIAANSDASGDIFVAGPVAERSISYANDTNIVWSRLPVNKLGLVFIGHDITTIIDDLTEKEHIHRLKYLGKMSVSVAHDTNNHLAIIMNILELIDLRADLSEDNQVLIQEAINSCQKASSISRQLVSFSRRQNLVPKSVRPATVGKYVEDFLCEELYKDTLLSIELEEEACIFCDPDHLRSAILSIVKNSIEAMQAKGLISLSIRSMNKYMVCITISDTGPGFASDDYENAADPFYTTKDGAAGLGLAGVQGFTQQSNGSLTLRNNINGGATAELMLPKSHIAMSEHWEDKVLSVNTDFRTQDLSILLIEDNEMLSDLMIIEFERVGYKIHSASNLEQGLEVLVSIDKLDILVTDIILPDGLGFSLVQKLHERFPQSEVIYITGYGSEEYTLELQKNPGRVLEKPFSILKLINLVQLAHKQDSSNNGNSAN